MTTHTLTTDQAERLARGATLLLAPVDMTYGVVCVEENSWEPGTWTGRDSHGTALYDMPPPYQPGDILEAGGTRYTVKAVRCVRVAELSADAMWRIGIRENPEQHPLIRFCQWWTRTHPHHPLRHGEGVGSGGGEDMTKREKVIVTAAIEELLADDSDFVSAVNSLCKLVGIRWLLAEAFERGEIKQTTVADMVKRGASLFKVGEVE